MSWKACSEIKGFIFHVPGLKPPALAGELLAIEKARRLR
jgi:hypothetical protein